VSGIMIVSCHTSALGRSFLIWPVSCVTALDPHLDKMTKTASRMYNTELQSSLKHTCIVGLHYVIYRNLSVDADR